MTYCNYFGRGNFPTRIGCDYIQDLLGLWRLAKISVYLWNNKVQGKKESNKTPEQEFSPNPYPNITREWTTTKVCPTFSNLPVLEQFRRKFQVPKTWYFGISKIFVRYSFSGSMSAREFYYRILLRRPNLDNAKFYPWVSQSHLKSHIKILHGTRIFD